VNMTAIPMLSGAEQFPDSITVTGVMVPASSRTRSLLSGRHAARGRDGLAEPEARRDTHSMASDDRKWISIADAAERLSVSPRTIRRFVSDGELPGYRLGAPRGRIIRVELADVDILLIRIPTVGSESLAM
jgi:excisionase family DNA binding protein